LQNVISTSQVKGGFGVAQLRQHHALRPTPYASYTPAISLRKHHKPAMNCWYKRLLPYLQVNQERLWLCLIFWVYISRWNHLN